MFVKKLPWEDRGKKKVVNTDFLREHKRAVKAGCRFI